MQKFDSQNTFLYKKKLVFFPWKTNRIRFFTKINNMDNYVIIWITSFPNKIFGHPRNPKQSLNRLKNSNGESFVEILNMAKSNEFL